MNAGDPRDRLAEYLGDELDARDQEAMMRRMAGDPALAAEVRGLRRALDELRRLDPAADVSARATGQRAAAPRPHLLSTMLRRAAIIVLAFLAGFAFRSVMPSGAAGHQDPADNGSATADSDWTARAAVAYMHHQDKSSLARSLIAVTQSGSVPKVAADR